MCRQCVRWVLTSNYFVSSRTSWYLFATLWQIQDSACLERDKTDNCLCMRGQKDNRMYVYGPSGTSTSSKEYTRTRRNSRLNQTTSVVRNDWYLNEYSRRVVSQTLAPPKPGRHRSLNRSLSYFSTSSASGTNE